LTPFFAQHSAFLNIKLQILQDFSPLYKRLIAPLLYCLAKAKYMPNNFNDKKSGSSVSGYLVGFQLKAGCLVWPVWAASSKDADRTGFSTSTQTPKTGAYVKIVTGGVGKRSFVFKSTFKEV
jgi:hypothetical protein